MPVTIKDLSRRCGLSVSAISKALNNYSDISEETRALVRKVALEMGYFPNAQARALKTNRSFNIGVVYENNTPYRLMHAFYASLLDSFKCEMERHGYDLTFINHNIGNANMSYLSHCRYRGMDGALVACVDFYNSEVAELAQSDVPSVSIDHLFSGCACVMSDNRAGVRDLVHHVAAQGHRRIAFLHGEYTAVTDSRVSSFYETMNELQLPILPDHVGMSLYCNADSARQAVEKLLALENPPSCILMPDDFAALGGIDAINAAGLRVPRDISIVGYDGIQISQLVRPRLTTLHQDTDRIGLEAGRLLRQRIENSGAPVASPVIVPGWLVPGETVAPPASA